MKLLIGLIELMIDIAPSVRLNWMKLATDFSRACLWLLHSYFSLSKLLMLQKANDLGQQLSSSATQHQTIGTETRTSVFHLEIVSIHPTSFLVSTLSIFRGGHHSKPLPLVGKHQNQSERSAVHRGWMGGRARWTPSSGSHRNYYFH